MDAAAGKMPPEDRPNLKQNNNKGGREGEGGAGAQQRPIETKQGNIATLV